MCGGLTNGGRGFRPGQMMAFNKKQGPAWGIWGMHKGGVYNARVEKLNSPYWAPLMKLGWRGILEVDAFWDGGHEFTLPQGPWHIGVVYNDGDEFAIITMPSVGLVAPYHHRMPLIVTDDDLWISDGKLRDFDPNIIKMVA